LIFDEVKGGFFATALLMATYSGASGKKWAFLAGHVMADSATSTLHIRQLLKVPRLVIIPHMASADGMPASIRRFS
jgi:hypothetical protein